MTTRGKNYMRLFCHVGRVRSFAVHGDVFSSSHNLKLREHILRWLVRELFELPIEFSKELSEWLGRHDRGFMRKSRIRLWEDEDFEKPDPKETRTLIKQKLPPHTVPPDKNGTSQEKNWRTD